MLIAGVACRHCRNHRPRQHYHHHHRSSSNLYLALSEIAEMKNNCFIPTNTQLKRAMGKFVKLHAWVCFRASIILNNGIEFRNKLTGIEMVVMRTVQMTVREWIGDIFFCFSLHRFFVVFAAFVFHVYLTVDFVSHARTVLEPSLPGPIDPCPRNIETNISISNRCCCYRLCQTHQSYAIVLQMRNSMHVCHITPTE